MGGYAKSALLIRNVQRPQRKRFCRICGREIIGGTLCPSCGEFIKKKRKQERKK